MSDDEMIRLMATENATQRGSAASAVLNEVAAVTKRLAQVLMANDANTNEFVSVHLGGRNALALARDHFRDGDGIGEPLVHRYLSGVRSHAQIREALAAMKQSCSRCGRHWPKSAPRCRATSDYL